MKKLLVFFLLLAPGLGSMAQVNLRSKQGQVILPEPGNWCLGFSAMPALSYLGNMFNGTDQQSPPVLSLPGGQPMTSIYLKKCRTATDFWRLRARVGLGVETEDWVVDDKASHTDSIQFNETIGVDTRTSTNYVVSLGVGREKRRGPGRLQIFYGPEVWVGASGDGYSWTHHNPTDADMTQGSFEMHTYTAGSVSQGKRVVQSASGVTLFTGAELFGGLEYFFLPKVSIGAEVGWGLTFDISGQQSRTTEYWEPAFNNGAGGVRTETLTTQGGALSLMIDHTASGAINVFFYF
jgi:hypothetical protein